MRPGHGFYRGMLIGFPISIALWAVIILVIVLIARLV